jgi:hypothetical protein
MGTLLTRNHSYRTAKQFMKLFSSTEHRVYAVIGNITASQSAATPTESLSSDIAIWDNVAGIKRITAPDVSMIVSHGTGTALTEITNGSTFSPYNHTLDLFGTPTNFLGYTKDGTRVRVWKCLFNNSSGTVTTTDGIPLPADDTDTGILVKTGDGYHWKYMYSFEENSVFFTDVADPVFRWMPVSTLTTKPSDSNLLKQWNVQRDAVDGSIDSIIHSSTFTGFNNAAAVTLSSSTGSNFAGTIATSTGTKQYVSISNRGTGYRDVTAIDVVGASTSVEAELTAMISPTSGHGFDVEKEMGAKDLMVTSQITNADILVTTVPRYATVALILDPIIAGSSQDDVSTSGTTITSGTKASATSYVASGLLKHSGQILYVDKRATITRNSSNTDTIRIVIQF